ncbi:MAG: transposase, partial [Tunicatimonas sp.]
MADKYQNKYRIASARAPWWDYGWEGAYFITICTHDRQHFFGNIEGGVMQLSPVGALAHQYWQEIPGRFPYAQLDAWVVMPNHMHGILIIRRDAVNR